MSKVPKLRFPEFEGEWEEKEFSNYIVLYRGSSPRPIQEYLTKDKNGVNWIKIGDTKSITNFKINKVEEQITIEGAKKSRKVNIGELILANSMSFGNVYELGIEGYIYDGWFVLREYEEHFDKSFLLQLLNSEYVQSQYKKLAAGGIVQNISSEIVYEIILPYLSLAEQQKIADCLSSLDELIEAHKEKIASLKAYKKGLLQQLFPQEMYNNYSSHPLIFSKLPKLRFAGFEGEWEEVKLGDVVKYENGKAFENNITEEGLFNVITLRSIDISGRLKDEHLKTNYNDNSLKKGDIVMVLSDVAHGDFLGLCAIIPTDDFVLNQRMGKLYKFKNVLNTFLCFYINNKQKEFKLLGQGSSQLNLSKQDILDVHFFLPSLDEQQKIADCLLSLDEKIAAETEQVAQLQQHKKSLLQQLLV